MENITVRKATPEDIPEILNLIKELAEFEHGLNKVTIDEATLLKDGFGEHPYFYCILAEVDGKIQGMAVYFYNYSTWSGKCLYLEDIVVYREHRTRGVGKALMDEIVNIARQEEVKRVSWQVLNWNQDAIDFYEKIGASLNFEWVNCGFNDEQIKAYKHA